MSIAEKLTTIAENEQKVYDAGYSVGKAEGGDTETAYNEGVETGKQAEYDAFWDAYQRNGEPRSYRWAFSSACWVDGIFKPKHNIVVTDAYMMFRGTKITNLNPTGITYDFSDCKDFSYAFAYSTALTEIPFVIDLSSATNLTSTFSEGNFTCLHIKSSNTTIYANGTFSSLYNLVDFQVDGTIGTNNFNIRWSSKLSKASIENIINCLSTDTSGLTVTLSLTAVKKAFETSSGANNGNISEEWLNLVATRQNWGISLA